MHLWPGTRGRIAHWLARNMVTPLGQKPDALSTAISFPLLPNGCLLPGLWPQWGGNYSTDWATLTLEKRGGDTEILTPRHWGREEGPLASPP